MTLPLVSIVIPTHNRADILGECLESVVNQTYKKIEVIVVNDNSEDNTEEILKEYSTRYDFFKYFNSDGKGGNTARNLGIKMAGGEYIAFMDDDDICELFRIEEQLKPVIESNYNFNFIVSAFSVMNSRGEISKVIDYLKPMESLGFTVRWLVKNDLLEKAGGFDIEQPGLQDVEFFWRMKENAKIYYGKRPVVKVRDSQVSITKDPKKMIDAIMRLLKLHAEKMGDREKNLWYAELCKRLASINEWAEYKIYFKKIKSNENYFLKGILFAALLFKEYRILKVHSKIKAYSEKILIRVFKKNPYYTYSS